MSFAEAQAELAKLYPGWTGPRGLKLRRYVFRRERVLRRRIAIRLPGEKRSRYRVTWDSLTAHCRELFPAKKGSQKLSSEMLSALDEYVTARITQVIETVVEPKLRELFDRDLALERELRSKK